jgi:hypothetical protein
MKKRIKNLITSIFGALIMLIDTIHVITTLFFAENAVVDIKQITIWALIGGFGYIFLMAKDSLIEGLTMGLLKIKKSE